MRKLLLFLELIIKVKNQSNKNVYVKSVTINGEKLTGTLLSHQDIMNGGEIIFVMNSTPINKK